MNYMNRFRILLLLLLLGALASSAAAKDIENKFTFSGDELKISNLIGTVEVRPTSGHEIRVSVMVLGSDAEEDLLKFETDDGSHAELRVLFPVQDHNKFVYPPLGRGSKTSISCSEGNQGGSWLKRIFGGDRITVRGKGSGLEVWADIVVEVPRDRKLEVKLGVGEINAEDVQSELVLDTSSGAVSARGIEGDLLIDTGSGNVELENCEGENILIDTGSGSVKGENLVCRKLVVDTGSGSVRAAHVSAEDTKIDTGSGSASLQLDHMGSGNFSLDTGSGDIVIELPGDASAHITADTGSGSMNNELQNAIVENMGRHEMTLEVGDGDAKVSLDAGSGSITVR